MRYGKAIALAGLVAGLVGLAPGAVLPGVAQVVAQTVDQQKAEGDRLNDLGIQQSRAGQHEAALSSFQQALTLYRTSQNRDREARALANLGAVYQSLSQYEKAIGYYQQALPIFQQVKSQSDEAGILRNLGLIYRGLSQYEQATGYFQRALPIYREVKDYDAEAGVLWLLGSVYQKLSQYDQAIDYYQQIIPIYQATQNRNGQHLVLTTIAQIYQQMGQSDKAATIRQQATALTPTSPMATDLRQVEALRLFDQGNQRFRTSQYEAARQSWEQALDLYRVLQDRDGEAKTLASLGNVYHTLSQYWKAIKYYEQALPIFQQVLGRNDEAKLLSNLGLIYEILGQDDRASDYHQKALLIFRETKDRNGEAEELMKLGSIYNSSKPDWAIGYLMIALPIFQQLQERNGEASALSNLGNAYKALSQYERTISYYEKALPIFQQIKDRDKEAKVLGSLCHTYNLLSRYEKAIDYCQQALAIFQQIENPNDKSKVLFNLGFALYQTGNLVSAQEKLYASIALRELIRADLKNDQFKVSIFESQRFPYYTLQQVLISQGKAAQALEVAERGRARAFVELLAGRLRGKESSTGSQELGIKLPKLEDMQQIAKAQNATLIQYSIVGDNFKTQGKQEIRQSELYIWVIAPTGEITFRKTDLKSLWQQQNITLAELVENSRKGIGVSDRGDRATLTAKLTPEYLRQLREQQSRYLHQLHQLLIEPIADLLPKDPNQRVIFMPQGELFLVPFPALLDANNKPLLEKHTLLTAPSIQVLQLTRQQRQVIQNSKFKIQNALVVGNPTMPKVVTKLGEKPMQLSDLPGAKREALEIAKLFNTQAITGAQATKSAIAQQMPSARIIHLATHGLLDDTKGLGVPGAIALAPVGNGQLNDGLLTSDEILDMKLNAELVVLSACDTGRGKITGDGVIGLSRSLITAGVPSIIVSLWKVPDEPTALLMTEFYKNLKKSPDKAQALRQAMLTTKQNYPDPLNWAAFTLIGEAE